MMRHLPKIFLLMAAFFAIFGAAAYFTVDFLITNEKTIVVPDLRGREIVDVLTLLDHFGLHVRIKDTDFSETIPKNHILDQDPRPGEVIKTGRDVRLLISKGPKFLPMPDLKGLSRQQALLILEKNGLISGVLSETFHHRVPRDILISQSPPAGRTVEQGASADLLISRGKRPKAILMPDLTGLFLDEAVVAAERLRLVVEEIRPVHMPSRPLNLILSQEPTAGHPVLEDSSVKFSVNRDIPGSPQNAALSEEKARLFRYRLPPGYLKQQIRIELNAFGATWTLYDELTAPNREIWIMVPGLSMSVLFLYKNNELIRSEIYD